jgi:parvulin-like peptidyl-prolyl isomerase
MSRFLRDPLAGFLAAAAGVFLFHAAGSGAGDPRPELRITTADIEHLLDSFDVVWMREPTEEELRELIDDRVRDEVFYREAIAMGLDRDDTVVRRRLRQRMELLAAEILAPAEPSDAELLDFLKRHEERYRTEPSMSFRQIYLSPERGADAEQVLAILRTREDGPTGDLGDVTLLPNALAETRLTAVAAQFGSAFAEGLARAPVGEWSGPIESAYGVHLVRLDRREEGRLRPLDEIRDAVRRDWETSRAEEAEHAFYLGLLDRYSVVVEEASSP